MGRVFSYYPITLEADWLTVNRRFAASCEHQTNATN
jgi:hypothetical protein